MDNYSEFLRQRDVTLAARAHELAVALELQEPADPQVAHFIAKVLMRVCEQLMRSLEKGDEAETTNR